MDVNLKRKMTVALATSLVLSAATAYADAAKSDDTLGEVVVTAQRREESIM